MIITLIVLTVVFVGVLLAALHKKGALKRISLPGLPKFKLSWKVLLGIVLLLLVWFFWGPIMKFGGSLWEWRGRGFKAEPRAAGDAGSKLAQQARVIIPILPCQLDWDGYGVVHHFECRWMSKGFLWCTGRDGTFFDQWDTSGNGEWINDKNNNDRGRIRNLRYYADTNMLRGQRNVAEYPERGWYPLRILCDPGVKGLELEGTAPNAGREEPGLLPEVPAPPVVPAPVVPQPRQYLVHTGT